jgi:hypothetical protein
VPGQPGPVGAGALDADSAELAEGSHPGQQGTVPGSGGRERCRVEHLLAGVDDRGDVQFLVSVESDAATAA